MRLIPATLFGRMIVILLAGLAVAQGSSLWLHRSERQTLIFHARMQYFAERIADAVPVLDASPREQRSNALMHVQTDGLAAALLPDSEVAPTALPAPLATVLAGRLGQDRAMRSLGSDAAGSSHGPGPGHIDIRLRDGQWVRFSLTPQAFSPMWPDGFVTQMLITLAAVVVVSLIAVHQATRPLRQLADAADALGRDLDAPPLPPAGPVETRRAVRAFNVMQERLRRLVIERSRALAAVSHDLRTPLTRLRLRTELIEDVVLRGQVETDLNEMQTMIDATLAYLRNLRESEPPRPIDITALLESLAEDEQSLGRNVIVSGKASAPYVGRLSALKRAVANLVDNAVKYAGAAELQIEDGPKVLRLIVQDHGGGIPPADLGRATEAFFRVDASRSRQTGGMGLGLAIAKDIAVLHGGDLHLENRPEGGLRATLTLPRSL